MRSRRIRGTCLVLMLVGIVATFVTAGPASADLSQLKVVFVALDRDSQGNVSVSGLQSMYVATATGIQRITPLVSNTYYDWPVWAMNGTKIVFTARTGDEGEREPIYMMDPDGTNVVQLTANNWRNGQPKVTPDGRGIVFTSTWDEFPRVALFRVDLATFQVENMSARSTTRGGFDSDPEVTADGTQVTFVSNRSAEGSDVPNQVYRMNIDGTRRKQITHDGWYNVDPQLSPDGRFLAISSYRGSGRPAIENAQHEYKQLILHDWMLVVRDVQADTERVLTQGKDCTKREFFAPCSPTEGTAWIPRWTPDGQHIGYLSIRGPDRSGLYMMNADGSGAHPVIETSDKAMTWYDWTDQNGPVPPNALERIGKAVPQSALLIGGRVFDKSSDDPANLPNHFFISTPDRWLSLEVTPSVPGLRPDLLRWVPDRRQILFTGRVPVDTSVAASRQAPVGHFPTNFGFEDETPQPADTAEHQVFIMASDGSNVRQLTTATTQDPLDALSDGELRGNTSPDMSPDGTFVIFTNLSSRSGESWILRKNLRSGDVLNLTSLTRGPMLAGLDAEPRYSPGGDQIAFMSLDGDTVEIFVMDSDGYDVRELTTDAYFNIDPAWSPDGQWIVYSSYRGAGSPLANAASDESDTTTRVQPRDWYLFRINVRTGEKVQLTFDPALAAFRPVWSPDGSKIAFLSFGPSNQPDIYVVDWNGADPHPLQVTLKTKETTVDWR